MEAPHRHSLPTILKHSSDETSMRTTQPEHGSPLTWLWLTPQAVSIFIHLRRTDICTRYRLSLSLNIATQLPRSLKYVVGTNPQRECFLSNCRLPSNSKSVDLEEVSKCSRLKLVATPERAGVAGYETSPIFQHALEMTRMKFRINSTKSINHETKPILKFTFLSLTKTRLGHSYHISLQQLRLSLKRKLRKHELKKLRRTDEGFEDAGCHVGYRTESRASING